MNNNIKIVGIILVAFTVTALILYFATRNPQDTREDKDLENYSQELQSLIKKTKTYDKLIDITYSSSGDMNGNTDSLSLDIESKILRQEFRKEHSDPLQITEYSVSTQEIEDIISYIEKYNFPEWQSLKTSSEIALDAPTTGISFTYDNSKKSGSSRELYYVDYNMLMPEDGKQALYDLADSLQNLKKNKIKEYVEEELISSD